MKENQFEPGNKNTSSPAPGLAAVNTHNPDEEHLVKTYSEEQRNNLDEDKNEDTERAHRTEGPE